MNEKHQVYNEFVMEKETRKGSGEGGVFFKFLR